MSVVTDTVNYTNQTISNILAPQKIKKAVVNGAIMGGVESISGTFGPVEQAKTPVKRALMAGTTSAAASLVVDAFGVDAFLASAVPVDDSMMLASYRSSADGLVFAALEAARNKGNRSLRRMFYNFLLNTGSSALSQQWIGSYPMGASRAVMRRKLPDAPLQMGNTNNPSTLASPGF